VGDPGLFGPESVAWRVLADPSMVLAGMRGLLIQALHPLAMAGVDQHSDYKADPWGRLQRTIEYVITTTFGDTAAAEAMGARVRAVHERVVGVDPHTGKAYRADDPDLLAWVHNVEVHSFVAAYRRYGGWLSDRDADRFVAEMTRVTRLVGLPSDAVPSTLDELRAVLREAPLEITPAAREGVRTILSPPLPLAARPLYGVAVAGAISLLPRRVRTAYGFPWFAPADLAVRPALFGLFRALNVATPDPLPVRRARARLVS
jgi:uncharacterized protein (DUF2236 family)